VRPAWFVGAAVLTSFGALSEAACPDPVSLQLQLGDSRICVVMEDAALKKSAAAVKELCAVIGV